METLITVFFSHKESYFQSFIHISDGNVDVPDISVSFLLSLCLRIACITVLLAESLCSVSVFFSQLEQ